MKRSGSGDFTRMWRTTAARQFALIVGRKGSDQRKGGVTGSKYRSAKWASLDDRYSGVIEEVAVRLAPYPASVIRVIPTRESPFIDLLSTLVRHGQAWRSAVPRGPWMAIESHISLLPFASLIRRPGCPGNELTLGRNCFLAGSVVFSKDSVK
jgi:hypothetical protein